MNNTNFPIFDCLVTYFSADLVIRKLISALTQSKITYFRADFGTMLVWLMQKSGTNFHAGVPLAQHSSHRQAFLLETITKDDS